MANTATITKLLTEAAGAYPAYDKTKLPQAMKFYIKALAGFDEKTLETAIEERIATSRWFPAVAELVETCRKVEANSRPNQIGGMMLEAAMIAHDRQYEAAHPFTGERWWELETSEEKI